MKTRRLVKEEKRENEEGKAAEKRVEKKNGRVEWVRISKTDVQKAFDMLHANMEPCFQGEWQREPWPERSYVPIEDYVIAKDIGEDVEREILEKGLRTTLQGDDRQLMEGETLPLHQTIQLKEFPKRCKIGVDVIECCVWGLDCFTRQLLFDCLKLCPELMVTSGANGPSDVRSTFIEKRVLPALNSLGERGWNLFEGMEVVRCSGMENGDIVLKKTAERMIQLMQCIEKREWTPRTIHAHRLSAVANVTDNFRAHPKGQGMICCRKGGLPKRTFVEEYLGEVYTPWRWFERQDAIKKLNPDSGLPDFYNIQIERPRNDDLGYGIIFVEGANQGNFASRLCHSCAPNCQTVSFCAEGRVTNAMFTLRHIDEGEELTWDYSCVTESEKEFHAAICLCGTSVCREFCLSRRHHRFFQQTTPRGAAVLQVMCTEHTFLDRTAVLLRACSEVLTEEDRRRLQTNGFKAYTLQAVCDPDISIPDWLSKWASLILEFVEHERRQLPSKLVKNYPRYTDVSADVEANGVKTNRLQNLAITLDKAKYFLRHQTNTEDPPVRFLSDDEVLQYLWTGTDSVVDQALSALRAFHERLCRNQSAHQIATKRKRDETCEYDSTTAADQQETGDTLTDQIFAAMTFYNKHRPTTPNEAREGLHELCTQITQMGSAHAALHDALLLKASTQHFFTGAKYAMFESAHVDVSDVDLPESQEMNGSKMSSKKRKQRQKMKSKKYRSEFLWAQLVAWFKQTVYEPTASLGADRRGCVCLPSIENCYAEPVFNGAYLSRQRPHMLRIMEQKADSQWPTGMIWSFKNAERVYGTPMLDVAIEHARGNPEAGTRFHQMLEIFKSVFQTDAFDVKPVPDSIDRQQ